MSGETEPDGPLACLDRAVELARSRGLASWLWACAPGGLIAWLLIGLYYAERVEGVRSLRPLFALALCAAFAARCLVLARWGHELARTELAESGIELGRAPTQLLLRASLWQGLELWLWLWPLIVVMHWEPWVLPLVLPAYAARAALAPSWLVFASTRAAGETGFGCLRGAFRHGSEQRWLAVVCEFLVIFASLGLAFNLGGFAALFVTLGQSALGFDLHFVRAFLSPRNHFSLLLIAALALVLLEPVRAALSARLFVLAELTRGGAAARMAVRRALAQPKRPGRAALLGLALFALLELRPNGARAQVQEATASPSEEVEAPDSCDAPCQSARSGDAALAERVRAILRHQEFAEFPDERWSVDELGKGALGDWLDRLLHAWLKDDEPDPGLTHGVGSSTPLPGARFFLLLAAGLLLAALAHFFFGGLARRAAPGEATPSPAEPDPFARSPEDHLAEAMSAFARDPRAALRAVYLAALVGLSRRQLLELAPQRSNGQYLRQLDGRAERGPFAELTRTFDGVRYGGHALPSAQFQHCLSLAQTLVRGVAHE